jgi:hypothetical protein
MVRAWLESPATQPDTLAALFHATCTPPPPPPFPQLFAPRGLLLTCHRVSCVSCAVCRVCRARRGGGSGVGRRGAGAVRRVQGRPVQLAQPKAPHRLPTLPLPVGRYRHVPECVVSCVSCRVVRTRTQHWWRRAKGDA